MKPSEIRQAIIDYIATNTDEGVLGSELTRELKVNRHTLAKHLEILNGQDILIFRQVGMAKLWFLNKTPFSSILETDRTDSVLASIFREVINKTQNLVFVVDKDYTLIYMNEASREEFGNFVGQKCYTLLKNDSPCKKFCVVKEFLNKNIEGRQGHITEINGKTYRVCGFTIKNPDGSLSGVEVATDITRQIELEKELKEIKKIINSK